MNDPIKVGGSPIGAPALPVAPAKSIEADVSVLILGGVLERTVEPFKGWHVTLHTLTSNERLAASKAIPNSVLESLVASQEASKVPNLVQAITRIKIHTLKEEAYEGFDGAGKLVPLKRQVESPVYVEKTFVTPAEKEALRVLLDNSPAMVIDALYTEFLKASNDMYEVLETGVKKN